MEGGVWHLLFNQDSSLYFDGDVIAVKYLTLTVSLSCEEVLMELKCYLFYENLLWLIAKQRFVYTDIYLTVNC